VKRAALALAALAAATVALAQHTTPLNRAEPRTGTTSQADSSPHLSRADKRDLLNKCVAQTRAANPNVAEKDIRAYCDEGIRTITSPR
jgi:hypothetical protein